MLRLAPIPRHWPGLAPPQPSLLWQPSSEDGARTGMGHGPSAPLRGFLDRSTGRGKYPSKFAKSRPPDTVPSLDSEARFVREREPDASVRSPEKQPSRPP